VLVAGGAALAGALAAVALQAVPLKALGALVGAGALIGIVVLSGRPRRLLLALVVATIVLDVKTYQAFHKDHTGGAPGLVITFGMVLLIPLVAMAIADAVAGRSEEARAPLPTGAYWVPLLPLACALPSLFHTQHMDLSLLELLRQVCFYGLYLYFALTLRRQDLPLVVGCFLGSVSIELPFAAIQLVDPAAQISIGGQQSETLSEQVAGGGILGRISGTQTAPNLLGSFLTIVLPLALVLTLCRRVSGRMRAFSGASLAIGGLLLLFTFSRASWIGVAVAFPLVLLLAAARGWLTPSQTVSALSLFAVSGLVLLALPPVQERLFGSNPSNIDFRIQLNQVATGMWLSQPLTGVGLNTFVETAPKFDVHNIASVHFPAHNIYLLTLAEAGVIGLAGLLVNVLWQLWRSWKASATADPLASLLAIGLVGALVALYVGELASFSTRTDADVAAVAVLLGSVLAVSRWPLPA
jgi:O-antigen ligase